MDALVRGHKIAKLGVGLCVRGVGSVLLVVWVSAVLSVPLWLLVSVVLLAGWSGLVRAVVSLVS